VPEHARKQVCINPTTSVNTGQCDELGKASVLNIHGKQTDLEIERDHAYILPMVKRVFGNRACQVSTGRRALCVPKLRFQRWSGPPRDCKGATHERALTGGRRSIDIQGRTQKKAWKTNRGKERNADLEPFGKP